ncbi:MAG TPA: toll/interleukin-1 receptor domain-containing protein [Gaiellaceae bacterium]
MPEYDFDLFISHASEDKAGFVRELVGLLRERGLRAWFDEAELQVGDSLVSSIDDGLQRSRFGVVILSQAFFEKQWTRAELDALANRELSGADGVVVLPIWLDVGRDEVASYSPLLANKLALRSNEGVQTVADKLERRVRGASAPEPAAPTTRLEPSILRGRVLPHSYSATIQSEDHAFSSRVVIAASVPTEPEPTLRRAEQELFEDALAASQIESFLQELTRRGRRPEPEHAWRLVDPTRTSVITVARPLARMAAVDGFAVEARAAVNLRHQPTVVPLGWLLLHVDIVIRPEHEQRPDVIEPIPLSLDDLFKLVYVPLTAVLNEIAPALLPAVTGKQADVLAVDCVVMPHSDLFTRYVPLDRYASDRISGSNGPYAIDWYPSSLDEIATPEARTAAIRARIEELFIDGGYRGFEPELERLNSSAISPPASA